MKQLWDALNQSSKTLQKNDLDLLQEALTHTSSGLNPHHEQLEFLGDAVLRLTASEFIASAYPHMPVGERSSLRATGGGGSAPRPAATVRRPPPSAPS